MDFRSGTLLHFLLLRRRVDPWLLTIAAASILVVEKVSIVLFAWFVGTGIYYAIFRPRTLRAVDPGHAVAAIGLAAGAVAIHLLNGSLPEDGRYASYPLYFAAFLPMAAGMTLVRDPVRQVVIGMRAGLLMVAVWAVGALIVNALEGGAGPFRYGFGVTQTNAAFAITFCAIWSRMKVTGLTGGLANRRICFYLALVPVLATGTRATLPVFLIAGLMDIVHLSRRARTALPSRKVVTAAGLGCVLAVAAAGWLLAPSLESRFDDTIREVSALAHEPDPTKGGAPIRAILWGAAAQVIAAHPVIGIGGQRTITELDAHLPEQHRTMLEPLTFSHNALLDEWMQRGILGICLHAAFFGFCFWRIWRDGPPDIRENAILMGTLTVAFGALHYLLLVDRHVALYALYFAVVISCLRGVRPPFRPRVRICEQNWNGAGDRSQIGSSRP
ncbi:O-antigen ligase family protein [Pseudohoeflea suaedae]|uniref:O-antigen ligase family protein n=1 Tax=Pseudohoeflea suaedae TaxID=877384 RepID=A0A4R5PLY1_9HYPH|nr:O-antigen ligase family protein [Pseudohoeflea suaedae]TDH37970.1 O-antigen ligase family protein [Pseudohoeflea suaedae]